MHPIAFRIGTLEIYWYGVLLALGFLVGWWTAVRRAPILNLDRQVVADIGIWLLVGGLVGARLFYVVEFWEQQFKGRQFWAVFNIREGGLVFYGGFLGGVIAFLLYVWWRKIEWRRLADTLAPSIPLGHAFGRLGCFLNGCCYGKTTSVPWAVSFPKSHVTGGIPVHPVQIYELLLNLALFGILSWLVRKRRFEGQIFSAYLIGYGVIRFVLEFYRGDVEMRFFNQTLTIAQLISIGIGIAGLVLWGVLRRVGMIKS